MIEDIFDMLEGEAEAAEIRAAKQAAAAALARARVN